MRRHFIDNHLNFKRLFGESISENVRDYSDRSKIEPGHYLFRLGRDRPLVAARIFERPPDDGDTPAGEILGEPCDPIVIWAGRDREPLVPRPGMTVEQEYAFRCADAAWAREHSREEPIANPRRKVDFRTLAPIPPPPPVEPKK
jgi:hypothetical protein